MKPLFAAVLIVFMSLIAVQSLAAQTPPMGAGTQSCSKWMATRGSTDDMDIVGEGMMTAWVQGFLSGMWLLERVDGKTSFLLPDAAGIQVWLDKWCRDYPREQLVFAGTALVKELKTGR